MKKMIMTPGPTYIHEDVRKAMACEITNPDLDHDFYEFYRDTCNQVKDLLHTKNDVLMLAGEGILGLEASCASLVEEGDRVLCIDNGIFGHGFGDFLQMYGGDVVYFEAEYTSDIEVEALEGFLKEDHDFKLATLVHCETPSGITNPVDKICKLLKSYGILTVVDSVSAIGGEPLNVDEWGIDIVLGGSQKCLSAAPGLTFLSVSQDAWAMMNNRKTPVRGYYCNLSKWQSWYEDKWFPYTQSISEIYGFRKAVERVNTKGDYIERHKKIGQAVRKSLLEGGLKLYPTSGHSNTVTTMMVPENIAFKSLYDTMLDDHGIMIAGAFSHLKDKVLRIGHMGENCYEEKLFITLKALDKTIRKHGFDLKVELHKSFANHLD
ncbi:alanine--glyoxylate aminotransferase family protein [Acidaminobacter sp. JC074]|uniref:pyridoxal-phosphate-dependent aminotransferase family protein n=1 Tax=Acidaminobacter sp. JC074 TaxID=2530199 RepID=UPI001F0F9AC7|nr:alanine--glyoxylate aminotransferase family protein [Acidaminobacter sp. JC074]MCH4886482.1 alanine--glyoxylate aminotransferase family protein [Acidaminobacter sp. JC074]